MRADFKKQFCKSNLNAKARNLNAAGILFIVSQLKEGRREISNRLE